MPLKIYKLLHCLYAATDNYGYIHKFHFAAAVSGDFAKIKQKLISKSKFRHIG